MYNIRTCKFKIGDKVTLKTGQEPGLFNEVTKNVLGIGTIKHIRPSGENNLCLIYFPAYTKSVEILDIKLLPAENSDTHSTQSKTKENDTILSSVETIEKEIDTPKSPAKYNVGQFVMFTPNGVKQFKETFGLSIGNLCKKLTIKNILFAFGTYRYEVVEFPSKSIPENLIVPLSDDLVKAHLQILSLMSDARTI